MCCEPEIFSAGLERFGKALDELRKQIGAQPFYCARLQSGPER
jgi:hypothetical protein